MIIEICANSYQSAANAQNAGAHRIELCSELAVGGITPSFGLIKKVTEALSIPVFVLIRPRSGNFIYSDADFEIMKQNIQLCKDLGCAGIVSGILKINNTIDVERTKELIEFSKPLEFTFHRAFDCVVNPLEALEQLIDMGANRILTSGQKSHAEKGLNLLIQLKEMSQNRIKIMPGSGINANNAMLFKSAGFQEIHASALVIESVCNLPKVPMNSSKLFDETIQVYSKIETIEGILKVIRSDI